MPIGNCVLDCVTTLDDLDVVILQATRAPPGTATAFRSTRTLLRLGTHYEPFDGTSPRRRLVQLQALTPVRRPSRTYDHQLVLVTGRDAHASTCDHAGWE